MNFLQIPPDYTVHAMFVGMIMICKDALFILAYLLYVCDESLLGKIFLFLLIDNLLLNIK